MTLRLSSLGSCLRCQVALEQGYSEAPTPEIVQGWYDRGTAHETECIEGMRADGWAITHQQHEVEFCGVLGHLDGLCTHPDDAGYDISRAPRVLEVKAPSAWSRFERAYKTDDWSDPYMHTVGVQLSGYMHATGMEAVVACVEDGKVKWFGVERPIFDEAYIADRIQDIERCVQDGRLPDCTQKDWPCRTPYLCNTQAEERIVLDDPAIAEFIAKDAAYGLLIAQGAIAEKERKKARDALDLAVGRYTIGEYDVTVYEQANPRTFDTDAMKADGVYDKYVNPEKKSTRWKVG